MSVRMWRLQTNRLKQRSDRGIPPPPLRICPMSNHQKTPTHSIGHQLQITFHHSLRLKFLSHQIGKTLVCLRPRLHSSIGVWVATPSVSVPRGGGDEGKYRLLWHHGGRLLALLPRQPCVSSSNRHGNTHRHTTYICRGLCPYYKNYTKQNTRRERIPLTSYCASAWGVLLIWRGMLAQSALTNFENI